MSDDNSIDEDAVGTPMLSSPKAEVDDSPLQKCMDRNKQSLKVKLMMRRPYKQLVDQGIVPPLKTPVTFHEQRQKLQRAKMGDLLKHKIQHRPDRTELIRQHILEVDTDKIDPSLAERQRMLKRARLADSLNDQLSHRPGPLELVQKNILHTDENVERAIKEGQIAFRATCEGALLRPGHHVVYSSECDDSSSEVGGLSPSQDGSLDGCSASNGPPSLENIAEGSITTSSTLSPVSSIAASPASITAPAPEMTAAAPPPPPLPPPPLPTAKLFLPVTAAVQRSGDSGAVVSSGSSSSSSSGSSRNRKKSKPKCQPKARTIKFHEYKGPPNAQKQQQSPPAKVETSYELLLQQQQLFLQWQLEWQHKYPQIILPASQKPSSGFGSSAGGTANDTNLASILAVNGPALLTSIPAASSPAAPAPVEVAPRSSAKLEEMKVSDLKAELKRRNLPVSGSKPQLLERLRLFCNEDGTLSNRPVSRRGSQTQLGEELPLPSPSAASSSNASARRVSCSSLDGSITSMSPTSARPSSAINMDVDAETADILDVKNEPPPTPPPLPPTPLSTLKNQQEQQHNEEKPSQSKMLLQQQLHLKLQQQQQQHLPNLQPMTLDIPTSAASYQLVKEDKGLPSFCDMFTPASAHVQRPPPPEYAQVVGKQRPSVKSQLVDDVLDILIRSGELPPSAANDPVTPTTPRNSFPELQYHPTNSAVSEPPPPPPLPSQPLTRAAEANQAMDIRFPDININDLGLDLDSFAEAMDLGVLDNVGQNPAHGGDFVLPHSTYPEQAAQSSNNDEVQAMDLDVADWLDTLLPPLGGFQNTPSSSSSSSSTSGFSSLGSDAQQTFAPMTQHPQQNHGAGDPLFSMTSDPYAELFSLDDGDLKLPPSLGTQLSWDRLDLCG